MGTFIKDGSSQIFGGNTKSNSGTPTGANTEWKAADANDLRSALLDVRANMLGTSTVITSTAPTSVSIDLSTSNSYRIECQESCDLTINNPTNAVNGVRLTVEIVNMSGKVIGPIRWGSNYAVSNFQIPFGCTGSTVVFEYDSSYGIFREVACDNFHPAASKPWTALSGTELITNGTFNGNATGWTLDIWPGGTIPVYDSSVGRTTAGSIRFDGKDGIATSSSVSVTAGNTYIVSAFIKASVAGIRGNMMLQGGGYYTMGITRWGIAKANEWTEIFAVATIPVGVTSVTVVVNRESLAKSPVSTGSVWLDDVHMELLNPATAISTKSRPVPRKPFLGSRVRIDHLGNWDWFNYATQAWEPYLVWGISGTEARLSTYAAAGFSSYWRGFMASTTSTLANLKATTDATFCPQGMMWAPEVEAYFNPEWSDYFNNAYDGDVVGSETKSVERSIKTWRKDGSISNLLCWYWDDEAAILGWAASTAYSLGDRRYNGANYYEVITAGTSAGSGGPTGTGSDITDGTVHWKYLTTTTQKAYDVMFGVPKRLLRVMQEVDVDNQSRGSPILRNQAYRELHAEQNGTTDVAMDYWQNDTDQGYAYAWYPGFNDLANARDFTGGSVVVNSTYQGASFDTAAEIRRRYYTALIFGARAFFYFSDGNGGAPDITTTPSWVSSTNNIWHTLRIEFDTILPIIRQPHWTTWSVSHSSTLANLYVGTRDYQGKGFLILMNRTASSLGSVTFTLSGMSYTPATAYISSANNVNYASGTTAAISGGQFSFTVAGDSSYIIRLV